jgi:hypothetical protein
VETFEYPAHVVRKFINAEGLRCTSFVCDCNGEGLPNDDNAQLIAAAPELYGVVSKAGTLLALLLSAMEVREEAYGRKVDPELVSGVTEVLAECGRLQKMARGETQ